MARFAAPVMGLILCSPGAAALQALTIQAGPAGGHAWSVQKIQIQLRFKAGDGIGFRLEASGVRLPEPLDGIRGLRAECANARLGSHGLRCRGGIIEVTSSPGLPGLEPASFELDYGPGRYRLKIDGLRAGDGELRIDAAGDRERWSLEAGGQGLPLAAIMAIFADRIPGLPLNLSSGRASGSIRWESGPESGSLKATLRVEAMGFSDAAGLNVGEDLAINADIEASRGKGAWRFSAGAALSGGQAYVHPVFLDADTNGVRLEAKGEFEAPSGEIRIHRFDAGHGNLLTVKGRALLAVDERALRPLNLDAEARVPELKAFHAIYLEPWLAGSVLAEAEVDGNARASLSWRFGGSSRASLNLDEVNIDDARARYGVLGLNGVIHWTDGGEGAPSRLAWRGANFYRIDIGGGSLLGQFTGGRFDLREPVLFPLLGGVFAVDSLEAEGLATEVPSWRFSGRLTPVSLAELSNRLAWPAFSGSLSGVIPSVRYAGGNITVDGTLSMQAFDGTVLISDLKLSQPFGVVPRATADINASNLSLDALTRTFSFGNIQGRLDGRVDNLVLENWQPAEFDAKFATPEGDTSRHRISQRAVENLASLGGAGRVLSSTVLRFFESFSYDRLGISCRLRNGICEMGGIESAERGYYIVKGGGLPPRIDVLGFNDRVDWNKLVARLKAARLDQVIIQ